MRVAGRRICQQVRIDRAHSGKRLKHRPIVFNCRSYPGRLVGQPQSEMIRVVLTSHHALRQWCLELDAPESLSQLVKRLCQILARGLMVCAVQLGGRQNVEAGRSDGSQFAPAGIAVGQQLSQPRGTRPIGRRFPIIDRIGLPAVYAGSVIDLGKLLEASPDGPVQVLSLGSQYLRAFSPQALRRPPCGRSSPALR